MVTKPAKCPECNSKEVQKHGWYKYQNQPTQRYTCKICGYRFNENTKNKSGQNNSRQICVSDKKMKNLTRANKTKALQVNKENSSLVNFSWHLIKLGRSEATARTYSKYVRNLSKLADLSEPEEIKEAIANHYKVNSTKRSACCAYDAYLRFMGGKWQKPQYIPEHKLPFIPTEKELQLAMNTGHKENLIFTKFLYETGARKNEAERLEWTDLDPERGNVTVKASKKCNSRIIGISKDLMDLLFSIPKMEKNPLVFAKKTYNSKSSSFHNRMKRLAKIHNNPRFTKIHLHTFRHCKALGEYHKTRDILHVMTVLGHKKIDTTYIYLRLYNQIYKPQQPNQFVSKRSRTEAEEDDLINNGWEFMYLNPRTKLGVFRKPKVS